MASDRDPTSAGRPDAAAVEARGGEYLVVARRYRPQTFDELIGQEQVSRALAGAIVAGRVGHAYLFTGARGVGKTSAARILAKALDCVRGPTPTPCNQCDICQSISRGSDVDVLEIDGASNRGIDEIRQLRQNVGVRPSRARFKIYIIDEVHMLTKEAFNALLKTLEEPPEHVKFIFCTTEPTKIPITILSRCQRFDFAGIRPASIQERLAQIVTAEGATAEPEALALLARRAAGSMRDSQSLLEQLLAFGHERLTVADIHAMLGTASDERLGALVRHLADRDAAGALVQFDAALADGVEVGQLLEQLLGYFRDCMALLVGCPADNLLYTTPGQLEQMSAVARGWGLATILAVVQILEQALSRLRTSAQGRTLAEIALVRVSSLEDLESISSLVGQLRAGAAIESPSAERRAPAVPHLSGTVAAKKKAESPVSPAGAAPQAPRAESADRPSGHSGEVNSDQATSDPESGGSPANRPSPGDGLLSLQRAAEVWHQARQSLTGLLADFAEHGAITAISAPNRLVVSFPAKYNSSKLACERPQNLAELEQALGQAAGFAVKLELTLAPASEAQATQPAAVSPRQQRAQTAEHPMIRQVSEVFKAQVVRVDGGESSP
ncbi:MAG TPA: DNA polymerase III subunit gamma/tau [Pirellulales bacterium]|jgi:DNA polymerase-3 subunit gamma/tau|nr:DNA polymerase III subunit gamma/tau [Pirellulales bacterium]